MFDAWLRQFAHLLLDGRLGNDFSAFWFWDAPLLAEALRGGPASALCDDVTVTHCAASAALPIASMTNTTSLRIVSLRNQQ